MEQICLKNITKKFGEKIVLDKFNLEIKQGEIVALMGESGKGKTTILNLIGLLDDEYQGEIFIEGKKVAKKEKVLYFRNKLGYLFQNFALIDNKTVSQNLDVALEYVKEKDKEKVKKEALEQVGLVNKINQKIFSLSGGEQQRCAIARILIKPCDIVLADEPTGSVDEQNKKNIFNLLKSLNDIGKTIIIVTHDKEIGEWCDRIINI